MTARLFGPWESSGIYLGGYGVVLGLWFFSGFLGAFLGSCLKLRGSIVFSCKANVSQCGSDLHRYYAQKKNPHTCACHATLAAEHERSKSLCVSPTSTRGFGLQDLGPRRLRPRKACGRVPHQLPLVRCGGSRASTPRAARRRIPGRWFTCFVSCSPFSDHIRRQPIHSARRVRVQNALVLTCIRAKHLHVCFSRLWLLK
jgi:hypothetical protein